jgi:CRP/FNR family transcriptional regulator/CRP/FNR family cyclic AMP-dependent transcriptional regulator
MNTLETREIYDYTMKVPLFQGLSPKEYVALCKAMVHKRFSANETVVYEDDDQSQTFFIIISGKLHVTVLTPEGKQTILATLQRGDFFGEMSILDGEPRSASVIAAQECELFMLYRKQLLEILEQYPKITLQMLITMSRRLRKSNRHINTLSMMSVYGRIADVILQLAREHGERMGDIIIIQNPPTHKVMAEMAGTSRETVSRILSQLRKKHFISTDKKRLVILNEEKLYD